MSRIEDENSGDNLAADVKELVGRGGEYFDVCCLLLIPSAPSSLLLPLSRSSRQSVLMLTV